MKFLAVYVDHNSLGKSDGDEFKREAHRFARHHGAHTVALECIELAAWRSARRKQLLAALGARQPLNVLAFFCHGRMRSLPQLDWNMANVDELAAAIAASSRNDVRIALYACSAGAGTKPGGDGGFADALRDQLVARGVAAQVDAHWGAGHTTERPFVRRFDGAQQGNGGTWLVEPHGPLWRRWVRALDDTTLKYDFPLMTQAEIHAALTDA
jgi:hypothetical protein